MATQPAVLGTARLNNFRLNYLPPALAFERPARVWFILGGVDVSRYVLYNTARIRDLVFDSPNTANISFYGMTPTVGQRLEIWADANTPTLLFGGELQTVDKTYDGKPAIVKYHCTGIDDTARANRRRPLGLWTNTSATTIAQWLISTYAPGMSAAGVEPGLPLITVNFDGSEAGMKGCLTQIAKLIGGYWYFENLTLYLFQTPPGPAPDPIDDTPGRFLDNPPIKHTIDKSQVRTRVFGKGASTRLAATVDATVNTIPLDNAAMFTATGGKAIAGVTPDGAASRVLAYTGIQAGGGGGLVGPGASPSAAPGLALVTGSGLESGLRQYAVTFTTAAGESIPGPIGAITVGPVAPPNTAPIPGSPTTGGAVDPGTYNYGATFVTATGETNLIAGGPAATVTAPIADPPYGTFSISFSNAGTGPPYPLPSNAGPWYWKYSFVTASGETLPSPALGGNTGAGGPYYAQGTLPIGPAGVIARRIYRTSGTNSAGPYYLAAHIANNTATLWEDKATALGAQAPTVNTTSNYKTIPLTQIPIGPPVVTNRRIYRWAAGLGWKLVDTIANNTATTYTDTKANSALGAAPPATNTALANQVRVTYATGGGSVTGRKLYRSLAGGGALKLLTTIADNTTTTYLDATGDGGLGAAPPASDTSGLVQPNGQVPAGSTSIIVANTSAFSASGGWAIVGNGEQAIRYTGITGTALTGVPASGVGSLVASVSYNSTITASPALLGVSGIVDTMLKDSPIHVWVQRDDPAAQAAMAALDGGGDGIYEHIVSDERRSETSLVQACDAELELYSRPLVTVNYATRDTKTKSGKTAMIATTTPAIHESLTIQDVAISELGIAKGVRPKFTVVASSVRHSFDAILRMLIRKTEA